MSSQQLLDLGAKVRWRMSGCDGGYWHTLIAACNPQTGWCTLGVLMRAGSYSRQWTDESHSPFSQRPLPLQDPQAELLSLDVLPPSMRDIRIPPPESGLESDP